MIGDPLGKSYPHKKALFFLHFTVALIAIHVYAIFMQSGKVKWFNDNKGFGFIVNEEGEDVFVHFSSIDGEGYRSLREGQDVKFESMKGPKGLHATHVVRADKSN